MTFANCSVQSCYENFLIKNPRGKLHRPVGLPVLFLQLLHISVENVQLRFNYDEIIKILRIHR